MLKLRPPTWLRVGEVLLDDERLIEELVAYADAEGVSSSDLDEAVHDSASVLASAINNEGVGEQIRFLVGEEGPEVVRSIIKALSLALK